MVPITIGNWLVSDFGIEWKGKFPEEYLIEKDSITKMDKDGEETIYTWMVHLVSKPWITKDDLIALNAAMIYAIDSFELPFDSIVFANSREFQWEEFD